MPEHVSAENLLLRLRWIERIRLCAALALVALTLLLRFGLRLEFPWRVMLVLAGIVAVYDALFGWLRTRFQALPREALVFAKLERLANAQIGLDLVFLSLVIHFSGGIENPFVVLYPVYPIAAAILLTRRSAYMHAALATLLLLAVGLCEALWPASHHHVGRYLPVELFRNPYFVAGEVVAAGIAVHVSVYLASAVATRLHQREREVRAAHDALAARSAELAGANEELRALEERKSRFLSLAAHELRGPLAATEGCLAVACDGLTSDPVRRAEALKRARSRIQGMLQIVRDLLALAGAHKLSETASRTRIAFDELARRVVEQYSDSAAARQIDLVFHPSGQAGEVWADERALFDALGNLVSNAIKYTEEGGHVKVAVRQSGREAVCEVIDDGIGIPESEARKLFTEFFRASNARASGQEGTGLGLSVVREIVEKHGGTVKIESLHNLGTCAAVTLPLAGPGHGRM